MHCLFYLGNNEEISLAELRALGVKNLKSVQKKISEGVLPENCPPLKLQKQLGGIIKISKIIGKNNNLESCVTNILPEILGAKKKGKIIYGLNCEGEKTDHIDILVNDLKKRLKNFDLSSRYLNQRGQNVNNKAAFMALKRGGQIFDIVAQKNSGGENYLARTLSVQDVDDYARRDYEKPFRDAKNGMLPPKLAQIMLNLATGYLPPEKRATVTIYDPFCGSGTVLGEALINGYKVTGSDINAKMIKGSAKNLDYLEKIYNFPARNIGDLFTHDSTTPFSKMEPISHIVCEADLGPAFSQIPDENTIMINKERLEKLYREFFRQAARVLPTKGNLVIALPFMMKKPLYSFSSVVEEARRDGLVAAPLRNEKTDLVYARPDQIIGRQIFKLVKN